MPKSFKELGLYTTTQVPVSENVRLATDTERNGFPCLWLGESYHYRGMMTTAAAMAGSTKRIRLGLAIVTPYTRHPGLIAMELAALDELSEGRMILGLGVSKSALRRHGVDVASSSPLDTIRESVELIRLLWGAKTQTFEGKVFEMAGNDRKLSFKPRREKLPIYVGGIGPRMLQLAGEVGDGAVLTAMTPPPYVKFALANVREGLKRSGRGDSGFELRSNLVLSVSEDYDAAIRSARHIVAYYMVTSAKTEPIIFRYSGVKEDVVDNLARLYVRKGMDAVLSELPEEVVRKMTTCGTVGDCIKKLKRYIAYGLDSANLLDLSPNRTESMKLLREEIVPELVLNQ